MSAKTGQSYACERCGALFHVKPSRTKRWPPRFCSRECRKNDASHFWSRVDIRTSEECWPWTGGRRVRGYGGCMFEGRVRVVHQVAFRLTHGRWPMYLRHSCDNPPCCNPAHLVEGTHADNMADKVARRRQPRGETNHSAKLTEGIVRAIRADQRRYAAIAAEYRVHPTHISRIKSRAIWKYVE